MIKALRKTGKLIVTWLEAHRRTAFVLLVFPAVAVRLVDEVRDNAKEFWHGCVLIWRDVREWAEWSFEKEAGR